MTLRWIRALWPSNSAAAPPGPESTTDPAVAGLPPAPAVQSSTWPAALALALQQARELPELASVCFAQLSAWLPVHQATLYCLEEPEGREPVLSLVGSYATGEAPPQIALGEGLLGQCALDHRAMSVDPVPPGFWRVASGTGESTARTLLLLPIVWQGRLLGVVELASLAPSTGLPQGALEALMPVLGAHLDSLLAQRRALAREASGVARATWLQAVFEGTPEALLVFDPQGQLLLSNQQARTLFALPGGSTAPAQLSQLLPEAPLSVAEPTRLHLSGRPLGGGLLALDASLSPIPALGDQGPCTCAVLRPAPAT